MVTSRIQHRIPIRLQHKTRQRPLQSVQRLALERVTRAKNSPPGRTVRLLKNRGRQLNLPRTHTRAARRIIRHSVIPRRECRLPAIRLHDLRESVHHERPRVSRPPGRVASFQQGLLRPRHQLILHSPRH